MLGALSRNDTLRLVLALGMLVGAIAAYYLLVEVSVLLRAAALAVVAALAVLLAWSTTPGRLTWGFLHDAQLEVRKVVWPGRKQTVQITLFVMVLVVIAALVLWFLDWILGGIVEWLLA